MIDPRMFQQMLSNQQQMQNFQQQFNQFQQQFQGGQNGVGGMDPRAIIQQKLNSGEMTQQQYEQLRNMANMLMGTNY